MKPSLCWIGALAALVFSPPAIAADDFKIGVPIACEFGKTCFIQQYVDRDKGPGVLDYRCSTETYDGHDGTDLRILSATSAATGVAVLAPADGVVKAMRDGMPDQLVLDEATRKAVAGKECGNGMVLTHPGGWETQLCHLRQGSVAVRPGDRVAAGQRVGQVGYSGLAAFAHVHITVRKNGAVVDPFTGAPAADPPACQVAVMETPLWTPEALRALAYHKGEIIEAGFTLGPVSVDDLERKGGSMPRPTATDSAFVFYGRFINLQAGDVVRLTVTGPMAFAVASSAEPLLRAKAVYVAFTGKKLSAARWPGGHYTGVAELIRAGAVAESRVAAYDFPE
jgi:hypothetical protein